MIEILRRFLETRLRNCDIFDEPKVAFDHAFGGVLMFIDLFPEKYEEVKEIWDIYEPEFERKVWGVKW